MEFLFGIFVFFIVVWALRSAAESAEKSNKHDNQIVVRVKQCPPHQWFWQEIVDQTGKKVGERICCKICGPMKSSEAERERE